jgi:hypothetical protein
MRSLFLGLILLVSTGLLSGCVIEPVGGGWHHHHGYYDRY